MTTTELIYRLIIARRYYNEGWTWYDLQCQMEEIFDGLGPEEENREKPDLPIAQSYRLDMGE